MERRMNRDLLHSVKPWTSFIKRRSMSLRYSVTDTRLKTSIRRWKWLTGLWTKKRSRSPCISAEASFSWKPYKNLKKLNYQICCFQLAKNTSKITLDGFCSFNYCKRLLLRRGINKNKIKTLSNLY